MLSRLKPLVGLALFAGAFALVEPGRIVEAVVRLDPTIAGVVVLLGIFGILVQLVKWRVLLRWRAPGVGDKQCLESLFVGFGLGCLSPGRLGELGRGVFLPGSNLDWVALSAIDRIGSTAVTIAAAAVGLAVLHPVPGTVTLIALFGLILGMRMFGRSWLASLAERWERTRQVGTLIRHLPGRLWLRNLLLSVAFNLLFFSQFWLLLSGLGEIQRSSIWAVPGVFAIKALLPISLFDVGVREIAAIFVMAPLGVEPEVAFAAAFALFIVNVLAPGLAGMGLILRRLKLTPTMADSRTTFRDVQV